MIGSVPTKVARMGADVERSEVGFRKQSHPLAVRVENPNGIALRRLFTGEDIPETTRSAGGVGISLPLQNLPPGEHIEMNFEIGSGIALYIPCFYEQGIGSVCRQKGLPKGLRFVFSGG